MGGMVGGDQRENRVCNTNTRQAGRPGSMARRLLPLSTTNAPETGSIAGEPLVSCTEGTWVEKTEEFFWCARPGCTIEFMGIAHVDSSARRIQNLSLPRRELATAPVLNIEWVGALACIMVLIQPDTRRGEQDQGPH